MEITPSGSYYMIVSDFMPEDRHGYMPQGDVLALQRHLREFYPDVSISICPNGNLELKFGEPFHGNIPPGTLMQELKSFLVDNDYKV